MLRAMLSMTETFLRSVWVARNMQKIRGALTSCLAVINYDLSLLQVSVKCQAMVPPDLEAGVRIQKVKRTVAWW